MSVVSSTNNTDRHNITEILWKEVLNKITINPLNGIKWPEFYCPSSLKQQSIDKHVASVIVI
jgi:hypothetical protein